MEIGMIIFFVVYVIVWFKGKTVNQNKARIWLDHQTEYLRTQFALVGDKVSSTTAVLIRDGPADYVLYTSGRRYVQYGHWWIKLKPRNDPFDYISSLVSSLLNSSSQSIADRITMHMLLDNTLEEKFVFAVIRKDLAPNMYKKRFDLTHVGKIASSNVISSKFIIYSESQKLADLILRTKVGQIIKKNVDRLESLVISSLPAVEPEHYETDEPIAVSLTFLMPDKVDEFDPFVTLGSELPDVIHDLKLTSEVKSKVNKNREMLLKEFSKKKAADIAEELAKKKAEAKRAEEEKVKKLSPAEQRKWEEKERLRNLKKQQKKKKA
ncbi:hypothetical protein BDB01DRAFT_339960 [Pilobolus umbonatus]|nr:hypothetical protein BDB01DRAFT_339960 [Pilobolus umbonatus]